MSDRLAPVLSSDVIAEAAAWLAQLETGDLSHADLQAFREWMHNSPRHCAEIRQLAELSAGMNVLADLGDSLAEAAAQHGLAMSKAPSRVPLGNWAVGGVCAMIIGLILTTLYIARQPALEQHMQLFTTVGGFLEQELADGSIVKLNTDSGITVSYTEQQRTISLQRGEALFEVAHDRERPFVVLVAGKRVTALGTVFQVRLDRDDLEVTVTEGHIQLDELAGATEGLETAVVVGSHKPKELNRTGLELIQLRAGQAARISVVAKPEAITIVSVVEGGERKLAWQQGLLDFSDTPLHEVISEITRHSGLKVDIQDPALRDLKFGGVFKVSESKSVLASLASVFDIEVDYIDNETVVLRSKGRE